MYSLENALRSFACLTKGDIIAIKYNERVSDFQTVMMLTAIMKSVVTSIVFYEILSKKYSFHLIISFICFVCL